MGLIQVRVPDELEEIPRRHLPAKEGALSKFVVSVNQRET
ncbi:hypothetical protein Ferp_0021 [Ferroglobus placidus DSM 10642]|uniref:Uncharacterized protein n=1 Tax=Ferroglobus placidus (strain DSM 10642 / AEDII12DO) TaxID=589924 RepID=D3S0J9_FERPA|nr:hypothetical protein Ferp_0021 [Ferroglobus placidus DSM 10642]